MEASISPENSYAITIFKLWEPETLPYLGITFGSHSFSFTVVEPFLRLLETIT